MKITKSQLRQVIREAIEEEMSGDGSRNIVLNGILTDQANHHPKSFPSMLIQSETGTR